MDTFAAAPHSEITSPAADGELLALLGDHAGVGLWDLVLHKGDPLHPLTTCRWSNEFRRLLGFDNLTEFPDAADSLVGRLHPDDAHSTLNTFRASLSDSSCQTAYDVACRLRMRDQSYRWFRLTGGVARDHSGTALRASGSLIDIHGIKTAEATTASNCELIAAVSAEAARTSLMVQRLETSAVGIGEVVQLVNAIASQANLLALSATIEAAHAGDAGYGVALVAAEIKELAEQTALASQDIKLQIIALQDETRRAVKAVQDLASRVEQAHSFSQTVAAVVERQTASARQNVHSVQAA